MAKNGKRSRPVRCQKCGGRSYAYYFSMFGTFPVVWYQVCKKCGNEVGGVLKQPKTTKRLYVCLSPYGFCPNGVCPLGCMFA